MKKADNKRYDARMRPDISRWLLLAAFLFICLAPTAAQKKDKNEGDEDDESALELLTHTDTVANPVYMPVIGIGGGFFGYHGDIINSFNSLTIGKPAIRINVSSFIGQQRRFRGNLTFMTGSVFANERTVSETKLVDDGKPDDINPARYLGNRNLKADIFSFGFNIHYSFKPLLRGKYLEPFISLGVETMSFNSTADYKDKNGNPYNYWSDGTIRSVSEAIGDPDDKYITQRDYVYETNLRSANQSGLKKYSNFSFAVPVDIGLDWNISDRVTVRAATSLHYTLTDLFDDLSSKSKEAEYRGKKGNDWFTFSYLSLHLDLFSQDRVKVVEELFANADDFDMAMYDDEDGDGIFDGWDDCPGTPAGVPVDTLGCPFDRDGDGVPDYLDREVSRGGAIVDEFGVEVNDATVVALLGKPALARKDVEAYLNRSNAKTRVRTSMPIPDKFKKLDLNNDGYLSFDELLKAINAYFDGTANLSSHDIRDLNNFFFDQ